MARQRGSLGRAYLGIGPAIFRPPVALQKYAPVQAGLQVEF